MHNDVLMREPGDAAETARLVEELRQRAKGAFGQKDMPSCEALYSKAIKLLGDQAEPQLYSNRALVNLNLGKLEKARDDARAALKKDPALIKAHYREAQALQRLGEWDSAKQACSRACEVPSASAKEVEQLKALRTQIEQDEKKDAEQKAQLRAEAQDRTSAEAAACTGVSVQKQMQQKAVEKQRADAEARVPSSGYPKDTKPKAGDMRGYKTRADGKTTSYFHMDISDEAKALIEQQGFGKPQKIDAPVEEAAQAGQPSSWNKAGTWESKKMLSWVEKELGAWDGTRVELPIGGACVIERVEGVGGNAEIVNVRGKRKHMLDLSFTLKWKLELPGGETAEGTLQYEDVTPDDDEPEITFDFKKGDPACRPVADSFVKASSQGLQASVATRLQALVCDFKAL